MPRPTDFAAVLQTLTEHHAQFVLVGGVAAVLEGAPVTTFDVDIVHDRQPQNLGKLLAALAALDARYRTRKDLAPDLAGLSGPGHHQLSTRCGPLDVLGAIGHGRDYPSLLPQSKLYQVAGVSVQVLSLEVLIEIKEEVGQRKDIAVLPVLRAALQRKRRQ